jgi:DNA invertase Pin-like site-specific DNA recombinase
MNHEETTSSAVGNRIGKSRAALYTRFSKKGARETSTDDQIRECTEKADEKGWVILKEFIRSDEGKKGWTLAKRKGLQELVELAAQKPRPYDVLIFHSSSRMGRNLSVTLPLIDELLFCGVELYFVDTGLSSTDPMFRDLFIMYGRNDEHFIKSVGINVKRGQRGRVLDGYVGCARTYGYHNRPKEDATVKQAYGRSMVIGVEHVINEVEAEVVRRCFGLCAEGLSCSQIVKTLNKEGVPAPLHDKNGQRRVWRVGTMIRLLTNTKYIGVHTYNKRKQVRNPKTGTAFMVPRPESEWDIVPRPLWRIVSDELWQAAEAQLRHKRFNGRKQGGLNRSEASRRYIFSGRMKCRQCGGRVNIVQAKKADPLYGCHGCRFEGTCENELQVSQTVLEDRLLSAMAANLEDPSLRAFLVQEFRRQLLETIDAIEAKLRDQAGIDALRSRQIELLQQRKNLLKAIGDGARYASVQDVLDPIEQELDSIHGELERPVTSPPRLMSEEEVDEFLAGKMSDLAAVLRGEPEIAKQEIQDRVNELWLEPIDTKEGPAYRVTGDLRLFATPEGRKVDSSMKISAHHSTSPTVPISVIVAARRRKAPALTLKEAMRQVLLDQPGFTCTTRVLASEIRDRRLYIRRDGGFADWKQINKQAFDCRHLFRFLGPGVVELIGAANPDGLGPADPSKASATSCEPDPEPPVATVAEASKV